MEKPFSRDSPFQGTALFKGQPFSRDSPPQQTNLLKGHPLSRGSPSQEVASVKDNPHKDRVKEQINLPPQEDSPWDDLP
jgi:hypothetical protein